MTRRETSRKEEMGGARLCRTPPLTANPRRRTDHDGDSFLPRDREGGRSGYGEARRAREREHARTELPLRRAEKGHGLSSPQPQRGEGDRSRSRQNYRRRGRELGQRERRSQQPRTAKTASPPPPEQKKEGAKFGRRNGGRPGGDGWVEWSSLDQGRRGMGETRECGCGGGIGAGGLKGRRAGAGAGVMRFSAHASPFLPGGERRECLPFLCDARPWQLGKAPRRALSSEISGGCVGPDHHGSPKFPSWTLGCPGIRAAYRTKPVRVQQLVQARMPNSCTARGARRSLRTGHALRGVALRCVAPVQCSHRTGEDEDEDEDGAGSRPARLNARRFSLKTGAQAAA
jgi:hypothetical protein